MEEAFLMTDVLDMNPEIEELKKENEELKKENKELKASNEKLYTRLIGVTTAKNAFESLSVMFHQKYLFEQDIVELRDVQITGFKHFTFFLITIIAIMTLYLYAISRY